MTSLAEAQAIADAAFGVNPDDIVDAVCFSDYLRPNEIPTALDLGWVTAQCPRALRELADKAVRVMWQKALDSRGSTATSAILIRDDEE